MRKIDFHVHTLSTPKDDAFEFSQEWLTEYINFSKLDAISITNHNIFDKDQYLEIQSNTSAVVFPGMELSLENGHVNLVFDKDESSIDKLKDASDKIQPLLNTSNGLSVNKFKEIFKCLDPGIMIFEYGKSNSINIDDQYKTDDFFKGFTFVLGVNNQLRFNKTINTDLDYVPVLFSDCHACYDDGDKCRCYIPRLALKGTYISVEKVDFSEIKEVLKEKNCVSVNPDQLDKIFQISVDNLPVNVSSRLNLVVGRRGTGKSTFLESIKKQFQNEENVFMIKQFQSASETDDYLSEQQNRIGNLCIENWVNKYEVELYQIKNHYQKPS